MRAIQRKRKRVRSRSDHTGIDLEAIARQVRYVGSVEHKDAPSEAGWPRPREDASKCSLALSRDFGPLTVALRNAIRSGSVGHPWEARFPRYVWAELEGVVFEARLVNRDVGEYKGYPLERDERPDFL